MKKAAIQIAALAAILLALCAACRAATDNAYTDYIPIPLNAEAGKPEDVRIEAETPGVISHGEPQRVGSFYRVSIRPEGRGRTFVDVDLGTDASYMGVFSVGKLGIVYDPVTGGFSGDTLAAAAFTAFCLAVAAIMLRVYLRAKGPAFYAYTTIYAAGFFLFALVTGLFMLYVTLRHALRPYDYNMYSVYTAISSSGYTFMMATAPFLMAFATAMAVSNAALLRHEGFSPKNVLGIGVSLALVAGEALAVYLYSRDFSGSEWEVRVHDTLENVYAAAFAYFECMLAGAIVCGVKAARCAPPPDADYILILGCRFRKDGTLTPLLRGRADRAIAYWRARKEASGREAVLVPSGGQGADEPISEAEALRRYLISQGVPEKCILPEDRSRNTYQNMEYSKALIDQAAPGAKVVYATTNYHVFRSGVWANLAGLPAEGMGSRTKWWYWPNAFMRECAGLLANRIWQEVLLLAAMLVFFGALSLALG